ncbi:hypothetical protein DICVIV_14134 [Dictyocaulus viviparus]|uniref:Uncharacterized protein n=1 Tax=Dictyocaulus viviparus TaxID=29172 RepID=A0A0D8XBW2_DICVI|nr:hypothetical protein DICVIV_14134 [Dictyocaulus viviparus]
MFDGYAKLIPLTFLLGFYVSNVVASNIKDTIAGVRGVAVLHVALLPLPCLSILPCRVFFSAFIVETMNVFEEHK